MSVFHVYRPKKVVEAFANAAAEGITQRDLESLLCSSRRAKLKVKKLMTPTPLQKRLLRWIWQRDIRFEDSVGMNWSVLGGLFTRGYLNFSREKQEDGKTITFIRVIDPTLFIEPMVASSKKEEPQ